MKNKKTIPEFGIGSKGHMGGTTPPYADEINDAFISANLKKAICGENCECKTGEDCYGDAVLNLVDKICEPKEKEPEMPNKYRILEEDRKQIYLNESPYLSVLTVDYGWHQNAEQLAQKVCDLLNSDSIKPTQEKPQFKTAEEVLKWYSFTQLNTEFYYCKSLVLEAMEEYANQFKK